MRRSSREFFLLLPQGSVGAASGRSEALLRTWVGSNLALLGFITAYFFTIVFANLLYPFFGSKWTWGAAGRFNLSDFSTAHSFGYWLLLLSPFAVTPVMAVATRAALARSAAQAARYLPEFRRRDYLAILALCYGYVIFCFWRADAHALIWQAQTAFESTSARFQILTALGYWPQMTLKSLLMFLSVYSFVRAFRSRQAFWVATSLGNLMLMSALLLLLNMKWPALLLYVALAICAFLFSSLRLYLQAAVIGLTLLAAYLCIAVLVTRSAATFETGSRQASYFLGLAFDRMAVGYPYYYETFTKEGQICGTIVDRIWRKPSPCQPSNVIFERIYGANESGLYTQPAAVHIYGYALGGWPGAMVELVLASLVIGAFIALPFGPPGNTTVHSMIVMGGLAGYFFSQLPVEASLIYDHGVMWWLALVLGYAGLRALAGRPAANQAAVSPLKSGTISRNT